MSKKADMYIARYAKTWCAECKYGGQGTTCNRFSASELDVNKIGICIDTEMFARRQ